METVQNNPAGREPATPPAQDWWFTFGAGHTFAGFYTVINGTYDSAREVMFAHFGNRWSHQYPSAEAAGVEQYSLARLDASDWPGAALPESTTPAGTFTAPVPSRYGLLQPGWYLKVETSANDVQRTQWLLVEDRTECKRPDCHVAQGLPWGCAVVTLRGRGIEHFDAYDPATVRIPADTAVDW